MNEQEIREKVLDVIVESTETELQVSEETSLYEEMELASIEVFVLLRDLEKAFHIRIPAAELRKVHTAGDLCALVVRAATK